MKEVPRAPPERGTRAASAVATIKEASSSATPTKRKGISGAPRRTPRSPPDPGTAGPSLAPGDSPTVTAGGGDGRWARLGLEERPHRRRHTPVSASAPPARRRCEVEKRRRHWRDHDLGGAWSTQAPLRAPPAPLPCTEETPGHGDEMDGNHDCTAARDGMPNSNAELGAAAQRPCSSASFIPSKKSSWSAMRIARSFNR